jgi:hypothetical protein
MSSYNGLVAEQDPNRSEGWMAAAQLPVQEPDHREQSPALEGPADFLVLLATQRTFNLPQYAHSFACFVRVAASGQRRLEAEQTFVISWAPRTLEIVIFDNPEPGTNLGLQATLDWAASLKTRIHAMGPFHIKPELYEKARRRRDFLESGTPGFVVLDGNYRPDRATNCMHAISDLGLTPDLLDTGLSYGLGANRTIIEYFRPWIEAPEQTHPWVAELLGLQGEHIEFQPAE